MLQGFKSRACGFPSLGFRIMDIGTTAVVTVVPPPPPRRLLLHLHLHLHPHNNNDDTDNNSSNCTVTSTATTTTVARCISTPPGAPEVSIGCSESSCLKNGRYFPSLLLAQGLLGRSDLGRPGRPEPNVGGDPNWWPV